MAQDATQQLEENVAHIDRQFGPFYRLANPNTQSIANMQETIETGMLKGRPSSWYGFDEGIVQAYRGPLPDDAAPGSFEFTTPVEPFPIRNTVAGQAW